MSYLAKALIIFVVAMAVAVLLNETTEIALPALHFSFLCLFMFGTSNLTHHYILAYSKMEPKRFPAYFMGVTGIKMLVYLTTVGIYVYIYQDQATPMLIAFLILYLLYTILEVVTITSDIRKQG